MADTVSLKVEFTGGLELLFSNQRKHRISIPAQDPKGYPVNVAYLIQWLCENLIKDPRKEMFLLDDTVRPGILVLINDADWELEGEEKYELQPDDEIVGFAGLVRLHHRRDPDMAEPSRYDMKHGHGGRSQHWQHGLALNDKTFSQDTIHG